MSFVGGMMPIERPRDSHNRSLSAYNSPVTSPLHSPAGSRRGSVSSISSVQTDSGLDRFRQFSVTSNESASSSKSTFKSLFHKKDKKPKEKKNGEKIVLTSKHAAAVKTKLMIQRHHDAVTKAKTAGVVGTIHSGHLTAADQEARHPHSGPPALHATTNMPLLTRIISADEPDTEDDYEKNQRLRQEWETSKQPGFARVVEHDSDESAQTSANVSADESESPSSQDKRLEPAKSWQSGPSTRNALGGRFRRDDQGNWKR